MTEAVRLGKLEPATLANAMGRVLPVGSAMGVQFSELAGLMAAMSRTGTTAEESTTQLTSVMAAFLKPTKEAEKALAKADKRLGGVGLNFDSLRESIKDKGLFQALRTLQDSFEGDNQALVDIFPNIRALRGVFDLLGPGLETNIGLLEEMKDSTGVLDEAFKVATGTLQFKWNQVLSGSKAAMIEIGELLKPLAVKILNFATSLTDMFLGLSDGMKTAVAGGLAMGPVLLGLAAMAKAVSFILGGFALLKVGALVAFGKIKLAVLAVTGTLSAISWPLVLGIAAIAAVALLIYKYWEPVKAFFGGFVDGVKEAMAPLAGLFGPVFNLLGQLVGWFASLFDQTKLSGEELEKATSAGKTFGKIVGGVLKWLLKPIENVANGIGWIAKKLGLIEPPKPLSEEELADQRLQELLDAGKEVSEQEKLMQEQKNLAAKQPFLARAAEENKKSLEEQRKAFEEAQAAAEKLVSGKQSAESIKKAIEKVKELKANIDSTLAEGVGIEAGKLPAALEKEFKKANELLPQSDAKRGPLSNLRASGRALMDTLAEGVRRADPLKLALEPALAGLEPLTAAIEPMRAVVEPVLERLEPLTAAIEPMRAVVEPVLEELAPLKMALDTGGASLPPLDTIAPPLPIAPLPTPALAGAGAAGSEAGDNKVEMSFGQGAIVINAAGGDAGEIAGHIEQELREKMRAGVEQLDSRIVG